MSQSNGFKHLTNVVLTTTLFLRVDTTATNSTRRFYRASLACAQPSVAEHAFFGWTPQREAQDWWFVRK
jgi:hypothetical protein